MADNNIDRYNPAAKTTYEDVARQKEISRRRELHSGYITRDDNTSGSNYMPGEGVYAQPKFPDYASRIAAAEYKEPYIARR